MKASFVLFLISAWSLSFSQEMIKKELPLFDKIEIQCDCQVKLNPGNVPSIFAEGTDTSSAFHDAKVIDGTLFLTSVKNPESRKQQKITLTYNQLRSLSCRGSSVVTCILPEKTDHLQLDVQDAAKCVITGQAGEMDCMVRGASSLTLSGDCKKLSALLMDAGLLNAGTLSTQTVVVSAMDASKGTVNAIESLSGVTSDVGRLNYIGSPKVLLLNNGDPDNNQGGSFASINISSDDAQEKGKDSDTTRIFNFGKKYKLIIQGEKDDSISNRQGNLNAGKIRKSNWAGVDLFENGYLGQGGNLGMPAVNNYMALNYGGRNLGFNLNLFEKDFHFAGGKLQIVTGLGFSFYFYALKSPVTLGGDSSYLSHSLNNSVVYDKNRLRESFVTIPLLLELNTSPRDKHNVHIAAGVIGGIKLGSSTKQIITQNNRESVMLRRGQYDLYPFRLDATVRIGYGRFTLLASYSLTPLFQLNSGPLLYPFSVGIQLVPFH